MRDNALEIESFEGIYIRVGARNVSLFKATNEEFDIWARSKMEIWGVPGPWSLAERVVFVQSLRDAGARGGIKH